MPSLEAQSKCHTKNNNCSVSLFGTIWKLTTTSKNLKFWWFWSRNSQKICKSLRWIIFFVVLLCKVNVFVHSGWSKSWRGANSLVGSQRGWNIEKSGILMILSSDFSENMQKSSVNYFFQVSRSCGLGFPTTNATARVLWSNLRGRFCGKRLSSKFLKFRCFQKLLSRSNGKSLR